MNANISKSQAKSLVVEASSSPVWQLQCDLLLDVVKPLTVMIQVFHTNQRDKKELCIGI